MLPIKRFLSLFVGIMNDFTTSRSVFCFVISSGCVQFYITYYTMSEVWREFVWVALSALPFSSRIVNAKSKNDFKVIHREKYRMRFLEKYERKVFWVCFQLNKGSQKYCSDVLWNFVDKMIVSDVIGFNLTQQVVIRFYIFQVIKSNKRKHFFKAGF